MKNNSLKIFLVFLLILSGAYLVYVKNSPKSNPVMQNQEPPVTNQWDPTKVPPQSISITASNGTFTPNELKLTQHQDTILKINATDQDYTFELKEFAVTATAPKGKVTEILLPAKAVGTYTYKCGQTCEGKVIVQDNDADTEFE